MQFININVGNKLVAEICGTISITDKKAVISIHPDQRTLAFQVVLQIEGAMYTAGNLIVPVEYISYLSNSKHFEKPSIRLIQEEPEEL